MKIIATVLCLVHYAAAFSKGVIEEGCDGRATIPGLAAHPITHQVQPPPYTVTASQPNEHVTVTISSIGSISFSSFAVLAIDSETGKPIGSWNPVKGVYRQMGNCPLATSVNNIQKLEVVLSWKAPKDQNKQVNFTVTIAKDFATVWSNVPVQYLE